jgi:transmembrane sensor
MKDGKVNISDSGRDAAIDWWLRHDEGSLSRKEQADFAAWLAQDEANAAAFQKISGVRGLIATRLPGARPRRKSRRYLKKAAATMGVGTVALMLSFEDIGILLQADHYTGVGQTKTVTLEDGSRIELDARSALAVHYRDSERRLTLLSGDAWFDVAPNPARPFVVEAAGETVTALGTAFGVAIVKAGAHVTVGQHRVAIDSGGRKVIVEEGQQSVFNKNEPAQPPEPVDVERETAWRRGRLIFENRPLGEVIEALGRYHRGYVHIANPALRSRRVSGVFRAVDPLAALDEIETSLGLHATYLSNYLIIIHE